MVGPVQMRDLVRDCPACRGGVGAPSLFSGVGHEGIEGVAFRTEVGQKCIQICHAENSRISPRKSKHACLFPL